MPTKLEVLTRNAAKVIAALENLDHSQVELAPMTGLSTREVERAVNYLKSQYRIEYKHGLLHLRPAAPEAPAPVEVTVDPVAVHEIEPTSAPIEAPAAPAEVPAPAAPVVQTSAPAIPEPTPVSTPEAAIPDQKPDISWHRVDTEADAADPAPALGHTIETLAAENTNLLRRNADLRTELDATRALLFKADNDIDHLRALLDQKKRALRYVAAAGRVNATYLALAKFECANAKMAAVAATVIDIPDLHWSDANTLAYLPKGWALLTPDERDEIAVRLINEIVANQRNNAWFALVRALNRSSAAVPAPAVIPC